MNPVINEDTRKLEADAQTIEQDLNCLTRDCSAWARKRAEQDLTGLMEDLKGVEADVSLMHRLHFHRLPSRKRNAEGSLSGFP